MKKLLYLFIFLVFTCCSIDNKSNEMEESVDLIITGNWTATSYYYFDDFHDIGAVEYSNYNEECSLYVEQDMENYFEIKISEIWKVGDNVNYEWSHSYRRADDFNYENCSDIKFGSFDTYLYDDLMTITTIIDSKHFQGWMDDEKVDIVFHDNNSMTLYVDMNVDQDNDEFPLYTFNFVKEE